MNGEPSSPSLSLASPSSIILKFDAIAHQLIAMNEPLRFSLAETPEEHLMVYRLRYTVVVEKGWKTPEEMPDGIEKDEYDDQALHLTAWDGEILAATTRLVFPSGECVLPTEAAFNLKMQPAGQVVDVGRTIVAAKYRDAYRHTLLQGVIGQVWLEVTRRGYFEMCAIMSDGMIERYHAVGFAILPVGDPQPYWGELRYPCRFDLMKTAETVLERFGLA